MSARIYIGNLHYEVGEAALRGLFERAGAVRSVEVIKDRWTGVSRGFGFVEMMTEEDAQAALSALAGVEIMGRPARLAIARPRTAQCADRDPRAD
jgi:RNA recognition motif-containing protein